MCHTFIHPCVSLLHLSDEEGSIAQNKDTVGKIEEMHPYIIIYNHHGQNKWLTNATMGGVFIFHTMCELICSVKNSHIYLSPFN